MLYENTVFRLYIFEISLVLSVISLIGHIFSSFLFFHNDIIKMYVVNLFFYGVSKQLYYLVILDYHFNAYCSY